MVIGRFFRINTNVLYFFMFLLVFTSFVSSFDVKRTIYSNNYSEGARVNVSLNITLNMDEKVINYGIEERVPDGWVISYVYPVGLYINSSNKIIWIINSSSNESYLSNLEIKYTVTQGIDNGNNLFRGFYMFTSKKFNISSISSSNISGNYSILGNTSLVIDEPDESNSLNQEESGNGGGGGLSSNVKQTQNNISKGVVKEIFNSIKNEFENLIGESEKETYDEKTEDYEKPKKSYFIIYIIIALLFLSIVIIVLILNNLKNKRKHTQVINSIKDNYL